MQFIYKNFTGSTGGTATASSNNDTLTIAAGAGITTTRSGDTIDSSCYRLWWLLTETGFIPVRFLSVASSLIGGNESDLSFIRQTQSYNSSTINQNFLFCFIYR